MRARHLVEHADVGGEDACSDNVLESAASLRQSGADDLERTARPLVGASRHRAVLAAADGAGDEYLVTDHERPRIAEPRLPRCSRTKCASVPSPWRSEYSP